MGDKPSALAVSSTERPAKYRSITTTLAHENVLYVGGRFGFVSPATNLSRGFVDLSLGSATPRRAFPRFNPGAIVLAMADDGGGGWFVGGDFVTVEGQTRQYLAHFLANGALDPQFSPGLTGAVRTLVREGNTLYVGGSFTTVNGTTRNRAAAFNIPDLSLMPWNPNVNGTVFAMAVSGTRVFLGGNFTQVASSARTNLAAVDATSGAVQPFVANTSGGVTALHVTGSRLYVGGSFATIGGVSRTNLAAVDPATGAVQAFAANTDGSVFAIQSSGTRLFVGGAFQTVAGVGRHNLAGLDLTTGALTDWTPEPGAQDVATTAVIALAVLDSVVYIGGSFDHLAGEPRANLAAVPASGDGRTVLPWNPGVDGAVRALAPTATSVAAGGTFVHHGARVRRGLAAYDLITGTLLNLAPRLAGTGTDHVRALAVIGDTLYFGGQFMTVNGGARSRTAAIDRHTGALLPWVADTNDLVRSMAVFGNDLYIAGDLTVVGNQARPGLALVDPVSGTTQAFAPGLNAGADVWALEIDGGTMYVGGTFTHLLFQPRSRLGAIDLATRTLTPFNPSVTGVRVAGLFARGGELFLSGSFTQVGGQTRHHAAAVSRTTGAPTGFIPIVNGQVRDIAVIDGLAYLAGDFTQVNGALRVVFAAVDVATGANNTTFDPAPASDGSGAHLSVVAGALIAGSEAVPMSGMLQPPNLFVLPDAAMGGVPGPPSAPSVIAAGGELRMTWSSSAIGGPPTGHVIEAAGTPGGAPFATLPTGSSQPSFEFVGVPPGVYYLRVRATNAAGASVSSPEVGVAFGNPLCSGPPATPAWSYEAQGGNVTLTWPDTTGLATGYTLGVGSVAGASNIGTFGVGAGPSFAAAAAPGAYFARLQAASPCGVSAPSRETVIRIGGVTPPAAPVVAAEVAGSTVTVTWNPVAGAVSYQLDAGSGPLMSNVAATPTGATALVAHAVPPGTYYVRVHAIAPGGLRATSREVVVIVP